MSIRYFVTNNTSTICFDIVHTVRLLSVLISSSVDAGTDEFGAVAGSGTIVSVSVSVFRIPYSVSVSVSVSVWSMLVRRMLLFLRKDVLLLCGRRCGRGMNSYSSMSTLLLLFHVIVLVIVTVVRGSGNAGAVAVASAAAAVVAVAVAGMVRWRDRYGIRFDRYCSCYWHGDPVRRVLLLLRLRLPVQDSVRSRCSMPLLCRRRHLTSLDRYCGGYRLIHYVIYERS